MKKPEQTENNPPKFPTAFFDIAAGEKDSSDNANSSNDKRDESDQVVLYTALTETAGFFKDDYIPKEELPQNPPLPSTAVVSMALDFAALMAKDNDMAENPPTKTSAPDEDAPKNSRETKAEIDPILLNAIEAADKKADDHAKAKLEAIRDEIEATDFMTLLGKYSCIEITKRNGEKTFIGKYAHSIHSLILNTHDNYVIAHTKVKHLAGHAVSPNRTDILLSYFTRSNAAYDLYLNIIQDQIEPKVIYTAPTLR